MQLARRAFLRLIAGVALVPASRQVLAGVSYPSRPVRIMVGFSAGSASDIVARVVAQELSTKLFQSFVVENRAGGGGSAATEAMARTAADGYTLILTGSQDAINASLRENSQFDYANGITPISSIAYGPLVLVVNPSFPATTIREFIAFIRANPGKVNFGSAGVGSVAHMAGELFSVSAGAEMVHVPYRGLAPALADLIGGRLQAVFATMPPAIAHVRAAELRALGVTSATSFEALPDVPPIGDVLPGYEASIGVGLGAPKAVSPEVVKTISDMSNAVLTQPEIKAKLLNLGMVAAPMSPEQFDHARHAEIDKWRRLIRTAHLQRG